MPLQKRLLEQGYIIGFSFSRRYALNIGAVGGPHHVRWRLTSALLRDALGCSPKSSFAKSLAVLKWKSSSEVKLYTGTKRCITIWQPTEVNSTK